jgi:hypothetical protein
MKIFISILLALFCSQENLEAAMRISKAKLVGIPKGSIFEANAVGQDPGTQVHVREVKIAEDGKYKILDKNCDLGFYSNVSERGLAKQSLPARAQIVYVDDIDKDNALIKNLSPQEITKTDSIDITKPDCAYETHFIISKDDLALFIARAQQEENVRKEITVTATKLNEAIQGKKEKMCPEENAWWAECKGAIVEREASSMHKFLTSLSTRIGNFFKLDGSETK